MKFPTSRFLIAILIAVFLPVAYAFLNSSTLVRFTGYVYDKTKEKPMEGALAQIYTFEESGFAGTNFKSWTDSKGNYSLEYEFENRIDTIAICASRIDLIEECGITCKKFVFNPDSLNIVKFNEFILCKAIANNRD